MKDPNDKPAMVNIPFMGYVRTQEELDNNEDIKLLLELDNHLREHGHCYVYILGGDYKDSIAKFSVDKAWVDKHQIIPRRSYDGGWNINSYWSGRLSWVGKRNNPKFIITPRSAGWLKDYSGETKLVKLDLKKEAASLLENYYVTDIEGNEISIGDNVIYMNLRYGYGGRLCRGQVVELKPHVRSESIHVVIRNDNDHDELSELKYPNIQVLVTNTITDTKC